MNIDKDALRKAAEAATKGPWFLRLSDNATPHIMHGKDPIHGGIPEIDELANRVCVMPAEIMQSYNSFNNAELICAANPATVIALLDELEAWRNKNALLAASLNQADAQIDKLEADKAVLIASLQALYDMVAEEVADSEYTSQAINAKSALSAVGAA